MLLWVSCLKSSFGYLFPQDFSQELEVMHIFETARKDTSGTLKILLSGTEFLQQNNYGIVVTK